MGDTNKIELYDIYDLWYQPFWQTTWFWWFAIVSAVGLIMLIVWYMAHRYRARIPAREKPAWQVALKRLEGLPKRNDSVTPKEFYGIITGTLKEYFQRRYGFDLHGKTDQEVLAYLTHEAVPDDIVRDLTVIFTHGVANKFADGMQQQELCLQDLSLSIAIVKRTMPENKK